MRSGYTPERQDYFKALRSMYDARSELMQESFARMDQLLTRELATERGLFEDDIAAHVMEDCKILNDESYEFEGEIFEFGNAFFRRIMRRSNVVTIITFLEASLSRITKDLLHEANARRGTADAGLKLNDFGPNNICERCRTVLTKYVGISDDQKLWPLLKHFVLIRNSIAHRAGFVDVKVDAGQYVPKDKNLKRAYDKLAPEGLSLLEDGELMVEPKLHDFMLEKVRNYLCDICTRADEHFSRPKAVKN